MRFAVFLALASCAAPPEIRIDGGVSSPEPPLDPSIARLVADLGSEEIATRESATLILLARGRKIVPQLRRECGLQTDLEIVLRLCEILDQFLRVGLVLALRSPSIRIGDRLEWSCALHNEKVRTVALAADDGRWRYPTVSLEIVDSENRPVAVSPEGHAGNRVETLSRGIRRLPAGGVMFLRWGDLYWGGGDRSPRVVQGTGVYRMRVIYDSSPDHPNEWENGGATEETKRLVEELHHERIVSDWVEFTVEP